MTPSEKRTVLIGLAVVGAAVLLRGGLQPAVAAWREARTAVANHEKQLDTLDTQLDRRDARLRRLRQKYGPAIETKLLPVSEVRVRFPQAVQETLKQGGMSVASVALQGVRRQREVPGVSMVSLRVEGTVGGESLPKVLAALRGCEVLALIEDARIEKGGGKGGGRGRRSRGGDGGNGQSFELSLMLVTPALTEVSP